VGKIRQLALFGLVVTAVFLVVSGVVWAAADYKVQAGDTLNSIARNHGISISALKAANPGLHNPNSLKPGQTLLIPVRATAVAVTAPAHSSAADKPGKIMSWSMPASDAPIGTLEEPRRTTEPLPTVMTLAAVTSRADKGPERPVTVSGSNGAAAGTARTAANRGTAPAGMRLPPQLASRRAQFSQRLLRTAMSYMGTPYVWAGTGNGGFDCSGFTFRVFGRNGIHLGRMADAQFTQGRRVARRDLQPGDLVFFTTYAPGASHVGIYIGNSRFIHASSRRGVTVSSLNESYYNSCFIGGRRMY